MPTSLSHRYLTPRDLTLLTVLDQHPFTAHQLLQLSEAWGDPFTHERLLRRRLQQLREAGWLQSFPLATVAQGGAPHYWKLTRDGYRILTGADAAIPARRYFESLAAGHHHHTQCLGDFLVKTFVSAHKQGMTVRHFARENSVKLEAGGFTVYPDCAFQIRTQDERTFHYCIELDNGTERVRSKLDTESIERKLRGYDAHQSQFAADDPNRYLVLFVTTRSQDRLRHILDLAALVMKNPNRTVFVGVSLSDYLACGDPLRQAVITDHRGLKRTLVPILQHGRVGDRVNASAMTAPAAV